jgi:hypothetical protein
MTYQLRILEMNLENYTDPDFECDAGHKLEILIKSAPNGKKMAAKSAMKMMEGIYQDYFDTLNEINGMVDMSPGDRKEAEIEAGEIKDEDLHRLLKTFREHLEGRVI